MNGHLIFPWNDNFETGFATIDEQHKKLVDIINELAVHMVNPDNGVTMKQVFHELIDYTHYHFEYEESVWQDALGHDALFESHQKMHQDFAVKVVEFKKTLDVDNAALSEDVLSFLTHWLAFHIIDTDKYMAKVLLAIKDGCTLQEAQSRASEEMSGAMRILISSILKMYDSLSTKTLQLMREIAERQRAEAQLRLSKTVLDSTLESIFVTDPSGILVDANPAFCQSAMLASDQVIGQAIKTIKPVLFMTSQDIWDEAIRNGHWIGEVACSGCGEEPFWLALSTIRNEDGELMNFAGVISSVSQLIERKTVLEHAANHDLLTGLLNRRLLDDRIHQAIALANRHHQQAAVCFLDLDGFKPINDHYGHEAGDQVLVEVAERLKQSVRAVDSIIRIGGDEFVLVIVELKAEADLLELLKKILQRIAEPVGLDDGVQVSVGVSIGYALYPECSSLECLMEYADQAMYQAKSQGKGMICKGS